LQRNRYDTHCKHTRCFDARRHGGCRNSGAHAVPFERPETYSQYQVFPNIETYASRFSDSAERQALTRNAGGAAAHDHQAANENSAVGATRVDAPMRNVSPRDQTHAQSPFPSAGGPIDD
jgi:hypothetical protein